MFSAYNIYKKHFKKQKKGRKEKKKAGEQNEEVAAGPRLSGAVAGGWQMTHEMR